ncbi:MAG: toll/interleukin-1 receptor domain-containing protein [Kiritimatiellae bacterium]|nr:toll/interleukin-1 receptor domain-containing protein [Kiritimatiellia bacterium]
MAHDFFISYSRKDREAVLPIKNELEQTLGIQCWMDLSGIPSGARNFIHSITPAIRDARLGFLFFLSSASMELSNEKL